MPAKFPTPIMVTEQDYKIVAELRALLSKSRIRTPSMGATVAEAAQRMLDEEKKK